MDGMYIILAVFIGLAPAYVAFNKGRNFFLWWLYGTLLFPVALVHSFLLGHVGGKKQCGYCRTMVNYKATHCPRCGYEFIQF